MLSKKMWQAFAVMCAFSVFAALIAYAARSVFPAYMQDKGKWGFPFGFGVLFMIGSIVFSLLREKLPDQSWIALLLNAFACGLFIGAYLVGKGLGPLLRELLAVALSPALFFLVLMAALSVPRLKEKRWYIALCCLLWTAALFAVGAIVWSTVPIGGNRRAPYLVLFLFSLMIMGLAIGALLSAESFSGLLYGMVTPCTVCIGFVAVIVLLALVCGDSGDCGCDCGGECCDCSPGYEGKKKIKQTKMSDLGQGLE